MATLITKNSSTASSIPTAAQLVQGELAVNVADKRLFTENSAGAVVELGTNPSSITTSSATITGGTVNNTVIGATTPLAGSFTNAAYTGTLTGGTGVVNLGSGQFYKDASGNVGIGTSAPSSKLQVQTTNSADGIRVTVGQGSYSGYVALFGVSGSSNGYYIHKDAVNNIQHVWDGTGGLERVRIDSSGNLLVGTTVAGGQLTVKATAVIAPASFQVFNDGNTGISLKNSAGGVAGSVVVNTSAVAYNTSSDYRLKNTIEPMTGALDKVALLKPCTYKWKVDGSDGQGFIAHELDEVVPGCVTGEKDATETRTVETSPAIPAVVDADGVETSPAVAAVTEEQVVPKYQGIDTSFLVATLVAAIQEQQVLIKDLTDRLAALEAK